MRHGGPDKTYRHSQKLANIGLAGDLKVGQRVGNDQGCVNSGIRHVDIKAQVTIRIFDGGPIDVVE